MPEQQTFMTLFADASFCSQTGAAGWGAWAKSDRLERGVILGKAFTEPMRAAHEAELCSISEALIGLHELGQLEGILILTIQSDCLRALQALAFGGVVAARRAKVKHQRDTQINRCAVKLSNVELGALQSIAKLTAGVDIWLRHVKGHSAENEGRGWVNDQCDALAKRNMRAARERILFSASPRQAAYARGDRT